MQHRSDAAISYSRLLSSASVDRKRLSLELASLTPPTRRYGILFTPRSGSTWLADLLSRQRLFGKPREYFNAQLIISQFAVEMNANTLSDYFEMLLRRRSISGVFGVKISATQLDLLLSEMPFSEVFGGFSWIELRRRNLVRQAVSLYKARASGHPHRRARDAAELRIRMAADEARIKYDADAIRHWLEHIAAEERIAADIVAKHGLAPLRLTYEDLMAAPPSAIVDTVHRLVHESPAPSDVVVPSAIERSATERNDDFERRFRREHGGLIERIELARQASGDGGTQDVRSSLTRSSAWHLPFIRSLWPFARS